MAQHTPSPSPQIEEDIAFQRRSWVAERVGWAGMALVILAALLGVFAVGPLSSTTKADAAGHLRIDYDGIPMLIVENGRPLRERLKKARVDEGGIMSAARQLQGLERMDQIKFAVLEGDGKITIILAKPVD